MAAVSVNQEQVTQEDFRKACWIVGTNILEPTALSDHDLIATYKGQGGAERGFRYETAECGPKLRNMGYTMDILTLLLR